MAGKDPQREMETLKVSESAQSISVRDLYPVFMKRHGVLRSQSMQISYGVNFRNILRCGSIANSPLLSLSRRLVQDYMHARLEEGVSTVTVNKELAFLKCMVSRAMDWGFIENNTLKGMHRLPESGRRDVFLSPEEAAALIRELPEPVASIVEFAIYFGFRRENILALKIESIRFNNDSGTGEVELVVKGGRLVLFPPGQSAVTVLKRVIGTRKRGYVFINPKTKTRYTTITKTYDRSVRCLDLTISN